MLNCGARSFDWRPYLVDGGTLEMHHGDITVDHPMAGSLDEMVAWARDHDTAADLVLLHTTECKIETAGSTPTCAGALAALLASRKIAHVTDCTELRGLTGGHGWATAFTPRPAPVPPRTHEHARNASDHPRAHAPTHPPTCAREHLPPPTQPPCPPCRCRRAPALRGQSARPSTGRGCRAGEPSSP